MTPTTGSRQVRFWPPIGFAHRGGRAGGPDNHLDTFRLGVQLGASGLESDVWLSADGEAVLSHDGVVRGQSITEVPSSDLSDAEPTLRQLLEVAAGLPVPLDIKHPEAAAATVDVARKLGAPDQVWICAPSIGVSLLWARNWPDVPVVCSPGRVESEGLGEVLETLSQAGVAALNLPESAWDVGMVKHTQDCGLGAWGWHAHQPWAIGRLLRLGVDAMFSDSVPMMMNAIRRFS